MTNLQAGRCFANLRGCIKGLVTGRRLAKSRVTKRSHDGCRMASAHPLSGGEHVSSATVSFSEFTADHGWFEYF